MARTIRIARAATALALGLAAGSGGESGHGRAEVYPVWGRLLVGGEPIAGARLAFHPAGAGPAAARPVAVTGPDGGYRLTTRSAGDGAPEGDYVVTVLWPDDGVPIDECDGSDPLVHDRLRGAYTDPATSALRASVGRGENEIVLRATVGAAGWNLPGPRRPGPGAPGR